MRDASASAKNAKDKFRWRACNRYLSPAIALIARRRRRRLFGRARRILPSTSPTNLFDVDQPERDHVDQTTDSTETVAFQLAPPTSLERTVISDSTIARINHGAANAAAQMPRTCPKLRRVREKPRWKREKEFTTAGLLFWLAVKVHGWRISVVGLRARRRRSSSVELVDDQSLIERTRQRVELAIPKDRIFYTLSRSHERTTYHRCLTCYSRGSWSTS